MHFGYFVYSEIPSYLFECAR